MGNRSIRVAVVSAAVAATATVAPVLHAASSGEQSTSAATGCASLAGVRAFRGGAAVLFNGNASGEETGDLEGGRETITLSHHATNLELYLTRRQTLPTGLVVFAGKVRRGEIRIKDKLTKTGGSNSLGWRQAHSGRLTYSGSPSASLSSAILTLAPALCQYQLTVRFGVYAKYSGGKMVRPQALVTGAVSGDREGIPQDLGLRGGAGPDVYHTCPGNPLLTGNSCYAVGGGWAVDFTSLKHCHTDPPGNCAETDNPVGGASLTWVLKPQS